MLFETIVKGVISLISFGSYLSFEYRKTMNLFELILYSATLMKFICCRSSLVEFFGSLKYTNISSANNDDFTFSLPICIPLTSFCSLIALVRN